MKRSSSLPDKDPVKAAELIELLRRSKIEVKVAAARIQFDDGTYLYGKELGGRDADFPAGSYIVDLNQPQRILIKSILEQDTPQDKAFVDDNMARFRRNQMSGTGQSKEDYGFYDITAWSLPLAFGLDAYWTEDAGGKRRTRVTDESIAAAKRGNYPGRASIAYIIPYETDRPAQDDQTAAAGLSQWRSRQSTLNAGGRNWPRGTFVVRVSRNPETIHDAVAKLAIELGVNVVAANSGFPDEGDTGVGGEAVISLRMPKIAMVADEAVDQTSYGSIWWTLDRYGIPFTPMTVSAIKDGGLSDFNVLIMPDGSAGRYHGAVRCGRRRRLSRNLLPNGGTVITVRGASVFAALKDVGLTSVAARRQPMTKKRQVGG